MRRSKTIAALFLLLSFLGCAGAVGRPGPVPALRRSPQELRHLAYSLEVSARTESYWEKRGVRRAVEGALRRALDSALGDAGFGSEPGPRPVLLRVSLRLDGTASNVRAAAVLVVVDEGRIVDRSTVVLPEPGRRIELRSIPRHAAVRLANAVVSSKRVHALALASAREVDEDADAPAAAPPEGVARAPVLAIPDTLDRDGELGEVACAQIADLIAVRVSERTRYRVVLRDRVREHVRAAKAASYAPCIDDHCRIALGRALAADKIVASEVFRMGEGCVLTAEIINLETEVSERAASVTSSCAKEALLGETERIVLGLVN